MAFSRYRLPWMVYCAIKSTACISDTAVQKCKYRAAVLRGEVQEFSVSITWLIDMKMSATLYYTHDAFVYYTIMHIVRLWLW